MSQVGAPIGLLHLALEGLVGAACKVHLSTMDVLDDAPSSGKSCSGELWLGSAFGGDLDSACRKCTGQETLESPSWNLGTLDGAVQCSMSPTPTWRPPVKDVEVGGTRIVYALISTGAGTQYSE